MNQKVFEETFSTKKVKGIISRNTFENLWREIFNILWRQIPTKQISEEISTKESLKNNFCKKNRRQISTKKNLKKKLYKRSTMHLHQKNGINQNKKHGKIRTDEIWWKKCSLDFINFGFCLIIFLLWNVQKCNWFHNLIHQSVFVDMHLGLHYFILTYPSLFRSQQKQWAQSIPRKTIK